MSEADGYEAWNPRRLCDTCGELYRLSQMRRLPGNVWSCNVLCAGERSATELAKANASQKPFLYRPVRNAKPEDPFNPDTFEADDGPILNFVARMVAAGTRYEYVVSGDPAPMTGTHKIDGLSWSAFYLNSVISDAKLGASTIARAKSLLLSVATQLRTRQWGIGFLTTSTKTNDALYGGFLDVGPTINVDLGIFADTKFYTELTASCGLAMLYAYRVFGTTSYLASARAAASFLRNVQAIGSNGTHFTSIDSAGSGRLYTGGIASQVSIIDGLYSDHRFYPSSLLALQFWNELKATDGDQQIGSDGTPSGLSSVPQQLLSTSMTQLRAFWQSGVTDSTRTTITGLSETTPRECFNAYPATKTNFSVVGTGRWEYQDGDASTGTLITSLNFAKGLSALFAYEGASSQVTAVDDWMRAFTSNAAFETPAIVSDYTLARSTTGTYAATVCPATLLQVRAPSTFAATAINGSSLYDWGAFGLLSPLWATTHTGTFSEARRSACGVNFRYFDRKDYDDDFKDRINLRGLSGLTYQTAFSSDTNFEAGIASFPIGTTSTIAPTATGLVFWVKGSTGIEATAGAVTAWRDQGPLHQDATVVAASPPHTGVDTVNGIPSVSFPLGSNASYLARASTMKDRNGNDFTAATQRTVIAILKPQTSSSGFGFNITGGPVFSFREQPCFECLFDLESFFHPNGFYVFANVWRFGGEEIRGPDTAAVVYDGQPVVCEWYGASTTGSTITVVVNGATITTTPATSLGSAGAAPPAGFVIGNCDNASGVVNNANFQGPIEEVLVYDWILSGAALTQTRLYAATRSGVNQGVNLGCTNDVMRAAMFGMALRQSPRSTTAPVH